ncbi:MAG TPA: DUF86 domain-containing protein [Chloroflexia bacterium]|nr:DUF86 domain-containing protein [Chloroflexia bacterium]
MSKSPEIFLGHILESIDIIHSYVNGLSKDDFLHSIQAQDSTIRRLEIIGEAVKNLPLIFRERYPDVPWHLAAGMRDKLIHMYFDVDLEITWETVKEDLPGFEARVREIVAELQQ